MVNKSQIEVSSKYRRGANPASLRALREHHNNGGRTSRKPLTDALEKRLPPEELADLIAKQARKGDVQALKLAASYVQSPETLSRMAGEREGEPIRIDSGWRDGLTEAEIADLERMAAAYNADAGAAVEAAMSIVNAKSAGV